MNVARQIFNSQHSTTDLIDLFGKRCKIDESGQTFQWLCLNEVSNYLTFKRICELAKHCCVVANERGCDVSDQVNPAVSQGPRDHDPGDPVVRNADMVYNGNLEINKFLCRKSLLFDIYI